MSPPAEFASSDILIDWVEGQVGEEGGLRDSVLLLSVACHSAHGTYAVVMEASKAAAHVRVNGPAIASKEEDLQHYGFVHECTHSRWHVACCEERFLERREGIGRQPEAALHLWPVVQGGIQSRAKIVKLVSVVNVAVIYNEVWR